MNKKNLEEYLKIVVDLEKNIYLEKQLELELKNRKKLLCCAKNHIEEPSIPKMAIIESNHNLSCILSLLLILGGIIGWNFFHLNFWWHNFLGFVGCAGLLFSCGMILVGIFFAWITWQESLVIEDKKSESFRVWQEYENKKKENQKQIEHNRIKEAYLDNAIAKIKKKLQDSQNRLQTIYSYGIVFPKYQNFAMMSSIYEYIFSGRCSTLEGRDGAYNILELELRLDKIIWKMDEIVQKIDQIKNNQYLIYESIQEVNHNCSVLIQNNIEIEKQIDKLSETTTKEISRLQDGSEIQTYILNQTQKELNYMNRMNYLSGNYKAAMYSPNF